MKTLIIIDVQKGFINDHNKQMVENIENLLKREKFNNIIATQFVNNKNSQYIKSLNWNAMFTSPEIDSALNLPKETFIVQKSSYGLPNSMFVKEGLKISLDIFPSIFALIISVTVLVKSNFLNDIISLINKGILEKSIK